MDGVDSAGGVVYAGCGVAYSSELNGLWAGTAKKSSELTSCPFASDPFFVIRPLALFFVFIVELGLLRGLRTQLGTCASFSSGPEGV